MTSLYSFDFGETTGIALGSFTDKEPYRLLRAWEVPLGLDGFISWFDEYQPINRDLVMVAEQFQARSGQEFVPDLTGIPHEGALAALWRGEITWQTADRKGKAGVLDAILQAHGLWQTGATLGHTDGRDANDAIIHALVYLKDKEHRPTLAAYFRN